MAMALNQLQRYRATFSNIRRAEVARAGETLNPLPGGSSVEFAKRVNTLLKDQVLSAQPGTAEEQRITVQRNPKVEEFRSGVEDTDWIITSAAWSPILLDLHECLATVVLRPIYNIGQPGLASDFTGADSYSCDGQVFIPPAQVDATRDPAQNATTITIRPRTYTHKNGSVVTLERDIDGDEWIVHGHNRLAGLKEALA